MWHHDVTNDRTCQFFRRLFDRFPVRFSTLDLHHRILRKKHIRDYDFGVQFRQDQVDFAMSTHSFSMVIRKLDSLGHEGSKVAQSGYSHFLVLERGPPEFADFRLFCLHIYF